MKGRSVMLKGKPAAKTVQRHRDSKVARDPRRKELLGRLDHDFVALQHAQISSKGVQKATGGARKSRKPVSQQELESSIKGLESLLADA